MKILKYLLSILVGLCLLISCNASEESKNKTKRNNGDAVKENSMSQDQLKAASLLIETTSEKDIASVNAQKLFVSYCGICHGKKGDMSLNGSKLLTETNTSLKERVAQIYFGKGTMTPFKNTLKENEIIALAKYIDVLKK